MKPKNISTTFAILAILALAILLISCTTKEPNTGTTYTGGQSSLDSSQELKKFTSEKEMQEFLTNSAINSAYNGYSGIGIRGGMMKNAVMESSLSTARFESSDSGASPAQSAGDYSQTNIQVAGVDEADFVKNDDKYIYVISQDKLIIVDAYPAENAKILSETNLKGSPRNMLLNKDRLIIFAEDDGQTFTIPEYDFVPRPTYTQQTHVYIYDVSDKKNPKQLKDYNIEGNYLESRMIGDYVYFITNQYTFTDGPLVSQPAIKEGTTKIAIPDVYYFPNPEASYNFNTIASFNIFDDNSLNAKTFLLGASNTIYVSEKNIYISYPKNLPYLYYRQHNEERFYNVILPLIAEEIQQQIKSIKGDSSIDATKKWSQISGILEIMYNKMAEQPKKDLIQKIENSLEEYEAKLEAERRKTVIHKIAISDGDIEYNSRGEVSGYLLNQFSLDENNGNLRVATTTEIWTSKDNVMYNNVFVLDDDMEIIGKLEALAPDERIYSTRFLGDRLYMVTFKRIDPLFVIDLSDAKNPSVLGELKIPGYSDYLHPYDENHIIGIGKETAANDWGGVSTKGVKIALFDVSDVKNPKEVSKLEIGKAGSDSEALRDHKAFLFSRQKNLLVLPITEVKSKLEYDSKLGYYRQNRWQGAYVFTITDDSITVKGKITHNDGNEEQRYYYGSPYSVRRALYMDDTLYTLSGTKIKANDLDNIGAEKKTIELPFEKERYYDYVY